MILKDRDIQPDIGKLSYFGVFLTELPPVEVGARLLFILSWRVPVCEEKEVDAIRDSNEKHDEPENESKNAN